LLTIKQRQLLNWEQAFLNSAVGRSGFCCDAGEGKTFLRVFALFNVSLAIAVCLFPALPASRPACTTQHSCLAMKAPRTPDFCCQVLANFDAFRWVYLERHYAFVLTELLLSRCVLNVGMKLLIGLVASPCWSYPMGQDYVCICWFWT
jgi:hypothetical protein